MVEAQDELPIPHFEDRLWGELDQRWRAKGRRAPSPRRRLRRRALLAAAAAVAAGVVLAVAIAGPPGSVPGSQPEPAEASVVERVLAATEAEAADADSIVHETRREGEGNYTELWYDEVTSASRHRTLTADGEPLTDAGWPEPPAIDAEPDPALLARDFEPEVGACDPATGLAADAEGDIRSCVPDGTLPPQPWHDARSVDHCRRQYADISVPLVRRPGWGYIQLYLDTGDIVEDGREDVDGRELIRLRNRDGSYVFLVDPETYLPVRITDRSLGGEPLVTTYERLERTRDNLALLSPPVPDGYTRADTGGLGCTELPA